jgi:hypothetical protein
MNAMIMLYGHISFPEELDDDIWMEKWAQIEYLISIKAIAGYGSGTTH